MTRLESNLKVRATSTEPAIHHGADFTFIGLFILQWIVGVGLIYWLSWQSWPGPISNTRTWALDAFNGVILCLPVLIYLCWQRRKERLARIANQAHLRDLNTTIENKVHENRLLEEQVRQSQKMEAIGRLAGGIAHDFNNLITIILGNAEFALIEIPAKQTKLGEAIETIADAGKRAAQLTKQLLAFSRKQLLEPEVLNVNRALTKLEKILRRLIGENIALVTDLGPEVWPVMADRGRFDQIVMNLVVNARDAMTGGGTLRIETTNVTIDQANNRRYPNVRPGRYVQLSVSDSGCGIPAELQPMIFEPFFTTKRPGEGTGMGLAIVFGIVTQSGGQITVASNPGQGTTFNIYLPRWEGVVDAAESANDSPPVTPEMKRVLLVEDEDDVRRLVRQILEAIGYDVVEARGGFQGLEIAAESLSTIDLLITDVVMPGVSGRQLADQLTEIRPKLKVLFISGYTHDVISPESLQKGGYAFLQKPFTRKSLTRKVEQVIYSASSDVAAV